MRFMMLMIPEVYRGGGNDKLPENFAPDADSVVKMMKYNEDLANAGILVSLDGLQPLSKGARITYPSGVATITDGPHVETKEVLGGYWIITVSSKEEAVTWASKCPANEGDIVEVRQIFDMEDFPADVQKAAASSIVRNALAK